MTRESVLSRRTILAAGVGALGLSGVGGYSVYSNHISNTQPIGPEDVIPRIIGHRGAADLEPENTLRAIRRAVSEGAEGVEVDVRQTNDEVLIALHDPILDVQTTGTGIVSNLPYEVVNEARVNGTEPIPTLNDVLSVVSDLDISLFLDIKVDGITEDTMEAVRRYNLVEETTIVAFEESQLAPAHNAGWDCGLLGSVPNSMLRETAIEHGYEYVLPHFVPVQFPNFAADTWGSNVKPGVWSLVTVEDELRESLLARPSVVITNRPDMALRLRQDIFGTTERQ